MVRTYDLLRSPTADTGDGTVIATGVTELPSMEHVDTPGDGTWRYWARTDEDGIKSSWAGPAVAEVGDVQFLIGLSETEILALPTSGSSYIDGAWGNVVTRSDETLTVDFTDIDNRSGGSAFCAALRYVRTGDTSYRDKVVSALEDIVAYDGGLAYQSVYRQMHGWVLAADLIGYYDQAFVTWIDGIRYTTTSGSNPKWDTMHKAAWTGGNNHGGHARGAYIACCLYLGDMDDDAPDGDPGGYLNALLWLRGALGDRSSYPTVPSTSGDYGAITANSWEFSESWTHDPDEWTPINPPFPTSPVAKAGALPMEAYRNETVFSTDGNGDPVFGAQGVQYQFAGMLGLTTGSVLAAANGQTDIWDVGDQALRRARQYLYDFGGQDGIDHTSSGSRWMDPLFRHIYGDAHFPRDDASSFGITATRWLSLNPGWLLP